MRNEIHYITSSQKETSIDSRTKNRNVFVVELDGGAISDINDYLNAVDLAFGFPKPLAGYKLSYDGYLDWIRDLSWLSANEYLLVINNYRGFMEKMADMKKEVIEDFERIVLPWWESEVEQCVVEGRAKPFNVYIVDR